MTSSQRGGLMPCLCSELTTLYSMIDYNKGTKLYLSLSPLSPTFFYSLPPPLPSLPTTPLLSFSSETSFSLALYPSPYFNLSLLYRGYSGKKLSDNIQCEIFQTILEEARENYSDNRVHELTSNLPEDLERNVDAVCQYVMDWSCS